MVEFGTEENDSQSIGEGGRKRVGKCAFDVQALQLWWERRQGMVEISINSEGNKGCRERGKGMGEATPDCEGGEGGGKECDWVGENRGLQGKHF